MHGLFNPGFFNPRLGVEKSGIDKSGVEKFMVEKSGVEKSGVGNFMVEKSRVELFFNHDSTVYDIFESNLGFYFITISKVQCYLHRL